MVVFVYGSRRYKFGTKKRATFSEKSRKRQTDIDCVLISTGTHTARLLVKNVVEALVETSVINGSVRIARRPPKPGNRIRHGVVCWMHKGSLPDGVGQPGTSITCRRYTLSISGTQRDSVDNNWKWNECDVHIISDYYNGFRAESVYCYTYATIPPISSHTGHRVSTGRRHLKKKKKGNFCRHRPH